MRKLLLLGLSVILGVTACSQEGERTPSASPQVFLPEDSIYISGLDRYRKIRLYFPKNYGVSDRSYPVLYMHDGQNLFDDVTSYVGEWGVDETLDSLGMEIIVVGIDNGQALRMTEYSPWDNERFGKGEGGEYVRFIVEELKPMIDSTYRTLSNRENTGIMGSSMGGLISHYAMVEHGEVFGKIGIFSPSYWYSDEVWRSTEDSGYFDGQKVYMLVGGREGGNMVSDTRRMEGLLLERGFPRANLEVVIDQEGEHNERFWRKHLAASLKFLFE